MCLKNDCQKEVMKNLLHRNSKAAILSMFKKNIFATNEILDSAFSPLSSFTTL